MEQWKRIPSHPRYEASTHGRIRNSNGKVIKQNLVNGYPTVGLAYGSAYVHRAVAECFCEKAEGQIEVNHIDCDRTNNVPSNLEWCTPKENSQHYVSHGRGVQTSYNLRDPHGKVYIGTNLSKLCRDFGLQQGNLHKVVKGERKSHKGWTRGGSNV